MRLLFQESEKLLKSAEKYFYLTFSSFWAKLRYKNWAEILGLLDNTLNRNYDSSGSIRENLLLPF